MRRETDAGVDVDTVGVDRHPHHRVAPSGAVEQRGDAAIGRILDPRLIARAEQHLAREMQPCCVPLVITTWSAWQRTERERRT